MGGGGVGSVGSVGSEEEGIWGGRGKWLGYIVWKKKIYFQ